MSGWKVDIADEAVAEIAEWPVELRTALTRIVQRIEALGMQRVHAPLVKHIEGKLWEMRPSGDHVEGRALYFAMSRMRITIVLAFIKKTQKTPRRLIELALQRMEACQ